MIIKPLLPPKAGYVEVIDGNGNHVYKPTAETLEARRREVAEHAVQEDNDAMLVDHEYRLTLVELGVTSDAV